MTRSVRPSVGRLAGFGLSLGRSVCHNFLKGWEVSHQYSYRSTCLQIYVYRVYNYLYVCMYACMDVDDGLENLSG